MTSTTTNNLPASMNVDDALCAYLAENGFDEQGYTAPSVEITAGPFAFHMPNPPTRQRVIAQHDLHHVLTGYGTDLVGEAEVGAFELRAGCTTPFLVAINLAAALMGMVLAPHRVVRAWRAAAGQSTLYRASISSAEARAFTVGHLREKVGIDRDGAAQRPRARHTKAPLHTSA